MSVAFRTDWVRPARERARVCFEKGARARRPTRLSACERKPAHASLISWAMYRLHKKRERGRKKKATLPLRRRFFPPFLGDFNASRCCFHSGEKVKEQ